MVDGEKETNEMSGELHVPVPLYMLIQQLSCFIVKEFMCHLSCGKGSVAEYVGGHQQRRDCRQICFIIAETRGNTKRSSVNQLIEAEHWSKVITLSFYSI